MNNIKKNNDLEMKLTMYKYKIVNLKNKVRPGLFNVITNIFKIFPEPLIIIFRKMFPESVKKKLRPSLAVARVERGNGTLVHRGVYFCKLGWQILSDEGIFELIRRFNIFLKKRIYWASGKGIAPDINASYRNKFYSVFPNKSELREQRINSKKFDYRPKISIIIPTYNTLEKFLKASLESVLNQSYDNWELCISDDASKNNSTRQIIKDYSKKDERIKFVFRKDNGHICKASNSALELATGDFIGLLDHDDVLWPNALYEVVRLLNSNNEVDLIYSDEDKLLEDGRTHADPFFKPDWSPDLLRSINYICHFIVIRKSVIDKVGRFRVGLEGAQDWDLFLRICRETSRIAHIPKVLYSWRKSSSSTAGSEYQKNYAFSNQKKALSDDLRARGYQGSVVSVLDGKYWRVKYEIEKKELVSIIIPTKDKKVYIERCLNSLIEKIKYPNYELVIVDTGSTDPEIFDLYEKIKKKHIKTKVLNWNKKFNFSLVCNYGVKKSSGKYLLFLNNDTEIISSDCLEAMLEQAQRKEVGVVGAKLLYPDGRIQHAGVILGLGGGAGHIFKYFTPEDIGRFFSFVVYSELLRNYSALTGACLMIKKKDFDTVKGFDGKFRIAFNDIDLCLKIKELNLSNIYTPFSVLKHYESISVGRPEVGNRDIDELIKETKMLRKKWSKYIDKDPFYNANLTLNKENSELV